MIISSEKLHSLKKHGRVQIEKDVEGNAKITIHGIYSGFFPIMTRYGDSDQSAIETLYDAFKSRLWEHVGLVEGSES